MSGQLLVLGELWTEFTSSGQVPGDPVHLTIRKCDRVPALHGAAATSGVPLWQPLLTLHILGGW